MTFKKQNRVRTKGTGFISEGSGKRQPLKSIVPLDLIKSDTTNVGSISCVIAVCPIQTVYLTTVLMADTMAMLLRQRLDGCTTLDGTQRHFADALEMLLQRYDAAWLAHNTTKSLVYCSTYNCARLDNLRWEI